MKRILITAFESFGEDSINPTQEILKALPDVISTTATADAGTKRSENSFQIVKLLLPVSFNAAPKMVLEAMKKLRPDAVISLGLAGGRAAVTPERVAINCMDARIADNDGDAPCDQPVVECGTAAYFSTLPIKKIVAAVSEEGIPCSVSSSAGTYVCNALMYSVLHAAAQNSMKCALHIKTEGNGQAGDLCDRENRMLCGFIHVPYIESMGKKPFIKLEDEIRAVKAAVLVCAREIS